MKFRFSTVAEEGDDNRPAETIEVSDESTTFEMMEALESFLHATGYVLPFDMRIGYVHEDELGCVNRAAATTGENCCGGRHDCCKDSELDPFTLFASWVNENSK